jgi:hypothetical protein
MQISFRDDTKHARHGARRRRVDSLDRGMRVRRAHDMHPGLAWDVDVPNEPRASGQEARVLQAA